MSKPEEKNQGRWLYVVGGVFTFIYLAVLATYSFASWAEIRAMQPNNLGDFLAGAFSPMAFAWLVLGFIQQGIELRQNSAALILQAEELRSAAKHAGDMVELQRKDFELRIQELEETRHKESAAQAAQIKRAEERQAAENKWTREQEFQDKQPVFSFDLAHRVYKNENLAVGDLTNNGAGCRNVWVEMEQIPGVLQLSREIKVKDFGTKLTQKISFLNLNRLPRTHRLKVHYTDIDGTDGFQEFIVSIKDSYLQIAEK